MSTHTATQLVARMGEATVKFLAALTPEQRAKATFAFANEAERTRWYYTPNVRNGLLLSEMTREQQRLAHQLVAVGLSRSGFVTAMTIIGLELTLDFVERWQRPLPSRDSGMYYLSIFGEPSATTLWGWRFEGHHISINYTIAHGRIISPTPTFFGANPAEIALNGAGVLRPLGNVEDAARELVHALTPEQRAVAILSPAAPPDLMQGNRRMVTEGATPLSIPELQGDPPSATADAQRQRDKEWLGYTDAHEEMLRYTARPKGLSAATLTHAQRDLVMRLIRQYIERMPDEVAETETAQLQQNGLDDIHFVWAGSIEKHQAHYYRLQSQRFLVEYDKAQDHANHIHSVWRDIQNDFGVDVLARHYAIAHRH
jgi:hypothetical protein